MRRAAESGVPVLHLFHEIKALGYTGSINLLHKYLNQGRVETDRIAPSPRRLTSWIMTPPSVLPDGRRAHLNELLAACPEMTDLARLVTEFAQLMTERRGNDLDAWTKQVRETRLPELDPFLRGLDQDHDAAIADLALPYSNGPVEGVNTIKVTWNLAGVIIMSPRSDHGLGRPVGRHGVEGEVAGIRPA